MAIKIVFVTGGAKSGKSSFALNEVSGIKGKKAFIATAEALDGEMEERIHPELTGKTFNRDINQGEAMSGTRMR